MTESSEYGYGAYLHRLPKARVVDRIDWLVERCRNRRVIHIGFADNRGLAWGQRQDGKWLHEHLAAAAADLVGIDSDSAAVAEAVRAGYEAHTADCADPGAVAALGLEPAEIVVAGEVLQSVDRPGPFLKGLQPLCGGVLIITAPNACGLMFTAAQTLRGIELQDPDHVMAFTWRTLNNLVSRSGWHVIETAVYTSAFSHRRGRSRLELVALRTVLGIERVLGRLGRPFAADGLIVVAEQASPEAAPG